MVARIGGIGTVVAHDEHMPLGDGHGEREGAGIYSWAEIRALVDGNAVDGDRLARALAGHGVARKPDQTLDEIASAKTSTVLLAQPMVRVLEHHHVASLQFEDLGSELAGDDAVARLDGVHHGTGGNHIKTDEENTDQQHDDDRNAAPDQGVLPAEAFVFGGLLGMFHSSVPFRAGKERSPFILAILTAIDDGCCGSNRENTKIGPTAVWLRGRFHALFADRTHLAELSRRSTMRAALPRRLRR